MRFRLRERFQTDAELDGLPPHALLSILRLPEEEYRSPWRLIGRRMLYAIALVLFVAFLAYRGREGYTGITTFVDALYYSTITLSTTGYGDVTPMDQQERLITALIVTPLRIVFLALLVGTTLTVLTKESRQTLMIRRWRKRMRNHTIVIGYGTKGRSAVAALLADGVSPSQIVIVDLDREALDLANAQGLVTVHGSATRSDVLRLAGVNRARAVVVAPNQDDTAVLVTLSVREIAPSATIIASVRESDNSHLLRQSGADSVVVSSETAGRLMGLATVTPSVTEMMEDLLSPDEGFSIAERPTREEEVGGNPRVLEDIVLGIVRSGALYRIDSAEAETVEPGDRILYVRGMENLEEGEVETRVSLDPEQHRAATAPRGPVAIIAGAGTGKTRTITHRIAHLVDGGFSNPDQVLAVTFTSRAASEMRERLALMDVARVQARTFHAAAMRQLGYFWPKYAGDLPWKLMDSKFPIMSRAARGAGLDPTTTLLKDLIGEVEWCKSSMIVAEDYPKVMVPQRRDCPVAPEQFVKAFKNYEAIKSTPEGMLLDFDDLLLNMAAALESNVGIAQEFRAQYRTFVVDEYQDVTPLQQRLLDAWLGGRDDITVVGDANQTIYSFNGATPDYLLDFTSAYPEATTVRLHRDYRSTPQVVDLANKVIAKAKGRVAGTRLELEGQRPAGPEPQFVEYPDEAAEAKGVAQKIGELINKGVQPAEIAVLYRINAQSAAIEYALEEAGIPYQVKGGEGFFSRSEIRQGLGALAKHARFISSGDSGAAPMPTEELLNAVKAALAPVGLSATEPTGAQERQRWQSLNALVGLIEDIHRANPQISFLGVMGMLQERVRSKNPPKVQGVTLVSVHMAKGLEWDAVFLLGLYEGMFPIHHALRGAGSVDAIEEERRLLYVGVTRAREHLHLSWSQSRQEGGKKSRVRTRFLDDLVPWEENSGDELAIDLDQARRRRSTGAKNTCAVCGTPLSTPEAKILGRCGQHSLETDQVVIAELRQWRLDKSKEMGVPAYVVFTDATLLAIAQRLPTTVEELHQVPGVGPMKIEQFAEDVLAIVSNYAGG